MIHLHLPLNHLPPHVNRLYVAFSGGIDSAVLLHRLLEYRNQYSIVLWHINHGLQENARLMEQFAVRQARAYKLERRIDKLCLVPEEGNLEANARRHRYGLFSSALTAHDALLTAHHMNDQAETLLLNIMRGSGAAGLRAIALKKNLGKGFLFRPLLNATRKDLENYAAQYNLEWVEDPSNESLQFDRNYIRHRVMPALENRWPSAVNQMHRVCEWQNENYSLLYELALTDLCECSSLRPFSEYSCLAINAVQNLSAARKKNLIRHWLLDQGKAVIGYRKINQLLSVLNSRGDATPVIEGDNFTIRLYQGHLYIVNEADELSLESSYSIPSDSDLEIPGIGFRQSRKSVLEKLNRIDEGQEIYIHFRTGEDQVSQQSHRLKRLFQRHKVPPWIRHITPQILLDDDLVALWLF